MSLHSIVPDRTEYAVDSEETELLDGIVRGGQTLERIDALLVDDDPDLLDTVSLFLERENGAIAVTPETVPESALDRLSDAPNRFDCVVSDYEMSGMDGIEFLETVREEFPDLPFVLYTGKGSEQVASEAISAGVTDYLQKEAGTGQYELLANRIENAVRRHRLQETIDLIETRLIQLADSTGEILWMFSADWESLLFVNSAYEDIWGRPVSGLVDDPRSFLDGVHDDDRRAIERAMERLSNGETVDAEYRVVDPEGRVRWVRSHGEPIVDGDGSVAYVSGITRNVTERTERERRDPSRCPT